MAQVFPVVMAGGVGSRLWPLSRADRPKQFRDLVPPHTMLDATLNRLDTTNTAPPTVICGAAHGALVSDLLAARGGGGQVIEEPVGRNTAAVAMIAARHVQTQAADGDGIVLLLPADHHVTAPAAFAEALARAIPLATDGHLVTMGIRPTRPETGFGYIRFGHPLSEMGFAVDAFVEKPDRPTAARYLAEGTYAWNAGIFVYRASTLLSEAAEHADDIRAQSMKAYESRASIAADHWRLDPALFAAVRSDSIDYAIMEKTSRAAMVGPVEMGWNDVGSWTSVRDLTVGEPSGANVIALDCDGSLIRSDGQLVAAVGLKDMIVIATADAVLVLPADRAQDVKAIVEQLKARGRGDLL